MRETESDPTHSLELLYRHISDSSHEFAVSPVVLVEPIQVLLLLQQPLLLEVESEFVPDRTRCLERE